MTPHHDHAALFLAPASQPAAETAARPESTVDCGAAAMRRLRNPFAIPPDRAATPTDTGHAT